MIIFDILKKLQLMSESSTLTLRTLRGIPGRCTNMAERKSPDNEKFTQSFQNVFRGIVSDLPPFN